MCLRLYFFIAAQIAQPVLLNGPGNLDNLGDNKKYSFIIESQHGDLYDTHLF